jgi:hypothetical protein
MKKKYMKFYKECVESNRLPNGASGLCESLKSADSELFSLLTPTQDDSFDLIHEGKSATFWGSYLPRDHPKCTKYFTPLRQNIVLLLAALNNEL